MEPGAHLLIQLVVCVVFGVACALIAQNRGRSAIGWFFVGGLTQCVGLIILLAIQDLKVQQERERRLADENRRLREKLKKDRMVADERHAEITRRVGAHDVALGVDTSATVPAALPGSAAPPPPRPSSASDTSGVRASSWFWANGLNRQGPVEFAALQQLWQDGKLLPDTLVWSKGMPKWIAVRDVPSLEEALDG